MNLSQHSVSFDERSQVPDTELLPTALLASWRCWLSDSTWPA